MRVYYFVKGKYGLDDLCKKHLKIARIDKLNDPFEFKGVDLSNPEHRESIEILKHTYSEILGILCFSRRWDHPVQWAHYADNHKGLCFGFNVNSNRLRKVNYSDVRLPDDVLDYLKKKNDDPGSSTRLLSNPESVREEKVEDFANKILVTKFSHWNYEQEYRWILELHPENDDLTYCVNGKHFRKFSDEFTLKEVLTGVRSQIKRCQIEEAIGNELAGAVEIFKVREDYSNFKMVRDG